MKPPESDGRDAPAAAAARPAAARRRPSWLRREGGVALILTLTVALLAVHPASRETFPTVDNLHSVLQSFSYVAIMSVGMTLVILTGGIDLSVGSVCALSACGAAMLLRDGRTPIGPGIALGLGIGLACGLFNGVMITRLGLAPFIVTLGTLSVARGLLFGLSGGLPIYTRTFAQPQLFDSLHRASIPAMLGFTLLAHLFLRHSRWGVYIYAIGGNRTACRLSGVAVARVEVLSYALAGLLAAVAGLFMASKLRTMSPEMARGYELDVIAAVVLGGTSLSGGQGSVWGTLIGAALMGVLRSALIHLDVPGLWTDLFLGGVILVAVAADRLRQRLRMPR